MIKPSRQLMKKGACAGALLGFGLMIAAALTAAPIQISREASSLQPELARPATARQVSWGTDGTVIPGGYVSGTWNAAGSPYQVEGTITVHDDSTLTIDPGVAVIFQGNYQFIIEGRLNAMGTETDSILFTAASSAEGWGGLRFINAHVYSRLEYCRLELGLAQGAWPNSCGGAVYLYGSIQAIKHCAFINNWADFDGGAVFLWGGAPEFAYNLFTDNLAQNGHGHALYVGNSAGLVLDQLTIAANGSSSGYSLYTATGTTLVMKNSILWDSYSYVYVPGDIDYTNVYGGVVSDTLLVMGDGNMSRTPHFLDLDGGDLRLEIYSPCVDAASSTAPYANEPVPNGARADMGVFGNSGQATASLPLLSFTADTLDRVAPDMNFGLQKIQTTGIDSSLFLHNAGRQVLQISSLDFSDDHFTSNFAELIDSTVGAILVNPDDSVMLTLEFSPDVIDNFSGSFDIGDNDATSALSVSLAGTGVNPGITVNPMEFEFGNVNVGEEVSQDFTITNTGTNGSTIQSLLVIRTTYNTANFVIQDVTGNRPLYDTLAVGGSVTYTAIFQPSGQLDFDESPMIESNAGNVFLHMTGSGSQPILHQDPDTLDYGVLALGNTDTLDLRIWNTGAVDLVLDELTLTDQTNYSYIYDPAQAHIPTDDTLTIPVVFHPQNAGFFEATLTITTNMPEGEIIFVRILGTGTSQTNWVIGSLSGTWVAANSPYYVVGDVSIAAEAQLTIESGVEVLFEGDFQLTVYGNLQASGEAPHDILFSTTVANPSWSGIYFKQGSSASLLRGCDFTHGADSLGGVLRIENAAPTFDQCSFYDNTATRGGAVAMLPNSHATFTDCIFENNSATYGGALFSDWYSQPQINGCEFSSNLATDGGALYFTGAQGEVSACEIYSNSATNQGGGCFLTDGTITEFSLNAIHDNSAAMGGGVGIRWYTKPFIHDEWIYGNTATSSGGGIFMQDGCSPLILKTLVVENTAPQGGAITSSYSSPVLNYCTLASPADTVAGWLLTSEQGDAGMISNSILWVTSGTTTDQMSVSAQGSTMMITYSDIFGDNLFPDLNNHYVDPLFAGTGTIEQRYALQTGSPALSYSEDGGQIGAFGGSSVLTWNITLSLLQNPVQLNSLGFILTTTVPLMAPPYLHLEQDLPDTVGYCPVDSSFMISLAPMIYMLPLTQDQIDYPSRATITFSNIFGQDTLLLQDFTAAYLSSSWSNLSVGVELQLSARSVSSAGIWGVMTDLYTAPKPLANDLLAVGKTYQIFSTVMELSEGRVQFTLTPEMLPGLSAENCTIARWDGGAWELLPSYLAGGTTLWAPLPAAGSYRVVWSENSQTIMLPDRLELSQNYPNPFNPETTIGFALPEAGWVKLEIFDLLGRKVATLLDGHQGPGYHRVLWSGANTYGLPVASGVYFYRLQVDDQQLNNKMILLR